MLDCYNKECHPPGAGFCLVRQPSRPSIMEVPRQAHKFSPLTSIPLAHYMGTVSKNQKEGKEESNDQVWLCTPFGTPCKL
eukprot:scaffold36714_cov19-Tisochrysis_lutea.AAC.1